MNYDYLTQLFSREEISNFHHYLVNILTQALASPQKPIKELSLLGAEEEEKTLFTFNQTDAFFYTGTISQKLNSVCKDHRYRVAVIQNGQRYTYETLAKKANTIAWELSGILPENQRTVAILLPKSFQLLAAMSGIAQFGAAWIILSPDLPVQRIKEILEDSGAGLIIGNQELLNRCRKSFGNIPVLCTDGMADSYPDIYEFSSAPSDLAYMVYTSGSTGRPKGVEIEQRSLLNFSEASGPLFGTGAVLSLCSISFDAFLLESMVALLNGKTIVLPMEGEQEDPAAIAGLIQSYAVGFIALTPSRLAAYLKNPAFYKAALRLEAVVCGGEHFPGSLLKTLSQCTRARIYNQYGPSETAIGVSTSLLNGTDQISVGKPMANCRFYILDNHFKPLPIGVFGGLYIGGVCVGRGYHNAPELTANVFFDSPFEPGERLYKTGDIAAWTEQGAIIIKGRADGQVKLRGQRIELEEIASRLGMHPAIRQAVVRLVPLNGQDILTAYYVSREPVAQSSLLEFAATYLPGYMVPSIFLEVDEIPLSANGKTDFNRLPVPNLNTEENTRCTEVSQQILSIFQRILNRPDMTAASDYFLFGGDSLNALETLTELESIFKVRLRVADLYTCRCADKLQLLLGGAPADAPDAGELLKAPPLDSYPLTPAQLGIYFETQLAPHSRTYNMPCGFKVQGPVDRDALSRALQELADMEPVLRTSFVYENNEIRQKIHDHVDILLEINDTDTLEQAKSQFVRPFDLLRAPLLRAALWQKDGEDAVIMMDMHHIIGDAMTAALLLRRLNALYLGENTSVPYLQYTDYAYWFHNKEGAAADKAYWTGQMQEIPGLPEIPSDHPKHKSFDFEGEEYTDCLGVEESHLCDIYCSEHELTPYMFFTGIFGIFMARLTGSQDMFTGSPVSGRTQQALSETAGLFINTLPLRLTPRDELKVPEYFKSVRDNIIGILDHPDISLEDLVSMSGMPRVLGSNPLYNTLVSMRPVETDSFEFGGYATTVEPVPAKSAKLELNLEIFKSKNAYHFRMEYASSYLDKATVALYLRSIRALIGEILADDTLNLCEYRAISPADRYQLIDRPNMLCASFTDLPVDRLIDGIAQANPHAPALIYHGQALSFGELKSRSDALAGRLMEHGVAPGNAVGLLCHRSMELVIAMLSILKTGSAYVPMLPTFPEKRLKYMAEISDISLMLCDHSTMEDLPSGLTCQFMEINTEPGFPFAAPSGRSSNDVCFILFTSGSTGKPKGAMVRHRSISNLVAVFDPVFSPVNGTFLCAANTIFDLFVTESLIAMSLGKCTVLTDEEEMMLPWKAARLIRDHNIKMLEFTPSRAMIFLNNKEFFDAAADVDLAMTAGEVMTPQLLDKFREAGIKRILNLYGPAETTIYTTMEDVTHAQKITIGRIFPNCRGYVLDENQRLIMPCAQGEFYFGGDCLCAGYVGRKDLTDEVFIPDPYCPGQLMYRTGDIVRMLPDGRYEFVGRRDHQIKLNGLRIELAEITKHIMDSGFAAQAATIMDKSGNFAVLKSYVESPAGQSCDPEQIRKYLESEIPAYMVPSEIHVLKALPRTVSGKTDYKALEKIVPRAPEFFIQDREKAPATAEDVSAPAQAAPDKAETASAPSSILPDLWKEALTSENIDGNLSFFEQGGSSLAALSLLSSYYNYGWTMTLSQFYEHPTLNGQIELLSPEGPLITEPVQVETVPKSVSRPEPASHTSGQKAFDVLLTGATGFFGAHLLKALIDAGYPKIHCLVRGGDFSRLEESLTWYFGSGWFKTRRHKISCLCGDINSENLGLDSETISQLSQKLAVAVHAAADVRHYANDPHAERTNRDGTANVLALARKAGARMVHVSTASLCAEYFPAEPERMSLYTEQDFDIGQNWQDSVYLRGKFMAEQVIHNALAQEAPCTIFRIGRLVGRQSDGVFQRNFGSNAFFGLVHGITCLDMISTDLAQMEMELTAVDQCAKALVLLLKEPGPVYHLFNPHKIPVRDILTALDHPLPEVEPPVFEAHIREKLSQGLGPRLSLLLSEYNRFKQVPFRIAPDCTFTENVLSKYNFCWERPDPAQLLSSFITDEF